MIKAAIEIEMPFEEWEYRLKVSRLIEDLESGQRLARAWTVQVVLDMRGNEILFVSPNILFAKLGIKR